MSDTMKTLSFKHLLDWTLREYRENASIFGIHRSLFYIPRRESPYATPDLFGSLLGTPVGPAAGPHTQLAQNILSAWLSGGRFIELKTVQVMDELEIPRPCIDMQDEGYNVEWSQELKLAQSTREYIHAWVMVHVLRRLLGFEQTPFDTIFNMSVGYNLEGIQSAPMTRFMDTLGDASQEIAEIQALLEAEYPQFTGLEIPGRITNSVTLSTMHGCPPDEIERIARYLLEVRGLHTTVKLNPTLLGKDRVLKILHEDLGYHEIQIPDKVFDNDLKYERAVQLIRSLQKVAAERGLTFGVKLSNTLPMANHRSVLPGEEMYMSGRALYPITMNLFEKLNQEFQGDLNVSFSAGADALNVMEILAAGALPVTVASDLLKPGGYSRMLQYLENLESGMKRAGAGSLEELRRDRQGHLKQSAARALVEPRYKKGYRSSTSPKVTSGLEYFDCAVAPCSQQCAVCQDIPTYNRLIAQGQYDRALEVILARNPLPSVTGYVCTHLCQTHCIRSDYDAPVAIRSLKRFAAEHGQVSLTPRLARQKKAAVIGSGPSGLAAAFFLELNGVHATVFEAKDTPGGMLRMIPSFRLPDEIIRRDIERISELGVDIELSRPVTQAPESLLQEGFDAVYLASGFQKNAPLFIEGIEGKGVFFSAGAAGTGAARGSAGAGQEGAGDWGRRYCHGCGPGGAAHQPESGHHRLPAYAERNARQPGRDRGRPRRGQSDRGAGKPAAGDSQQGRAGYRPGMPAQPAGRAWGGWAPPACAGSGQRVSDPGGLGDRSRRPIPGAGLPGREPGSLPDEWLAGCRSCERTNARKPRLCRGRRRGWAREHHSGLRGWTAGGGSHLRRAGR